MYRGRNIPSKSTPSTVQCQKCLKRGHYSYECKASAAERPYIPRPSRTQQLFNPKLLPKLTQAAPPQDKKGVADDILAQREAERAKKKELDRDDESPSRDVSPRRSRSRSASVDSVSTISTRSPSPRPSRHSRSPPPRRAHAQDFFEPSPKAPSARQRSIDSRDRYSSRRSESPVKHSSRKGSPPARRRSPSPRRERGRERGRGSGRSRPSRRDYSVSESRSRSPVRSPVRRDSKGENHRAGGYYRDREDGRGQPRYRSPSPQQRPLKPEPSYPPPPPRERSLSPFSKRLALTKSMNMDGR
ncbi:zinc knuckle-domain-containing protein [Copromyces sp. CBS 386.78]|nr:zinc knuckle-domain-containing protein [Copromyces sp. CBS 386.78]